MSKENPKEKSIMQRIRDRISPLDLKKTGDRMELAARIDDFLKEKGLTQKQFADMMGKEASVISKWLSGTHNFTVDTLSEISNTLDIRISDLFLEKPDPVVFKKSFAVTHHGTIAHQAGAYAADPASGYIGIIEQGSSLSPAWRVVDAAAGTGDIHLVSGKGMKKTKLVPLQTILNRSLDVRPREEENYHSIVYKA